MKDYPHLGSTERLVKKLLPVKLTTEEKSALGQAAGELNNQLIRTQFDFDDLKADFKNKIAGMQEELKTMLKTLRDGSQFKDIECMEVKDYEAKKVRYILGEEVLMERSMVDEDTQVGFL